MCYEYLLTFKAMRMEGNSKKKLFSNADCIVFNFNMTHDIVCLCRWGKLDIVSGTGTPKYSDQTIMYAAGYLEGALTAK